MTGERVVDVISAALLLSGSSLALIAALGLLRLPDIFSRMHAATKPSTLGLLLLVIGAVMQLDNRSNQVKLVLVAVLQFITAPVAAHMIGRAAYRSGVNIEHLVVDELAASGEDTHPER